MEIGKPQRVHRVEPLKEPVPEKPKPVERPQQAPPGPRKVGAP